MADDTWKAVAVVAIVVIMIVIIYAEFKFLRRKREAKVKELDVGDQALNALITTRAIASSLERSGIRSDAANDLIMKAELARSRGDSRAVLEMTSSAKDVLMKEKQRHQQIGDLAKLPPSTAEGVEIEEPAATTKEKIEKELPKNLAQARFMLAVVGKSIEEGRREGRGVDEAVRLQGLAQKSFDEKDYEGSLKLGIQAKKAAEEVVIEIKPTDRVTIATVTSQVRARACKSCGASLAPEDLFCRKCGVKVELLVCPSCGTAPREGDAFCRKCGVAFE